jgi:hypothetical protein
MCIHISIYDGLIINQLMRVKVLARVCHRVPSNPVTNHNVPCENVIHPRIIVLLLVGGIPTPLKIRKSVRMIIPNIWKKNKCSKLLTRYNMYAYINIISSSYPLKISELSNYIRTNCWVHIPMIAA